MLYNFHGGRPHPDRERGWSRVILQEILQAHGVDGRAQINMTLMRCGRRGHIMCLINRLFIYKKWVVLRIWGKKNMQRMFRSSRRTAHIGIREVQCAGMVNVVRVLRVVRVIIFINIRSGEKLLAVVGWKRREVFPRTDWGNCL
jgi:hypothetical protein